MGGLQVDMRAEVAVLTRDVVVEGDADSARDMFGAVVMLHAPRTPGFGPSNFWLEQIEVCAPPRQSSASCAAWFPRRSSAHDAA